MLLVFAAITALVSGIVLRRSYRLEPANFSGFWHLSLVDLWASMFYAALLMFVFRAIWPDRFVPIGMVVTVVLALGFTFCLLLAARKGCTTLRLKILCAQSYFWGSLGWMAVGMFVFIIAFIGVVENELGKSMKALVVLIDIFSDVGGSTDRLVFNVVRVGFVCIPLSWALRKYVERQLARQREAIEDQP